VSSSRALCWIGAVPIIHSQSLLNSTYIFGFTSGPRRILRRATSTSLGIRIGITGLQVNDYKGLAERRGFEPLIELLDPITV
jgi:hypothetical protein